MQITLNGAPKRLTDGTTVSAMLKELGVKEVRVAVEVNLEVIRREARSKKVLVEGDRVEIVSFVGGGR